MKLTSTGEAAAARIFWFAVAALGAMLFASPGARADDSPRLPVDTAVGRDFDCRCTLDFVTVAEQVLARSTRYTVQLQLDSGAEQLISIAAPPGGLQLEMRDMTGDKVPNDLILIPKLLRSPPTVLVNDGHDHFTVAIAGTDPGSLSGSRVSELNDTQDTAALVSPRIQVPGPANAEGFSAPRLQIYSLHSSTRWAIGRLDYEPSSGRSPPILSQEI